VKHTQVNYLENRHNAIEDEIAKAQLQMTADDLIIADLKSRKQISHQAAS
jgi:hypothetical protein